MAGGSSKTLFTNPFAGPHDNDNRPSSAGSAMQKQTPGVNATGAYLLAGIPFVLKAQIAAGKVNKISFPRVTRSITITNRDAAGHDMLIAFANTAAAWDHHSIELDADKATITLNVRCKEIYVKGEVSGEAAEVIDYEIVAELTPILAEDFPSLGSSNVAGITADTTDSNYSVTVSNA